jgi:hypothetical protein
VSFWGIKNLLKLLIELNKVGIDAFESSQVVHSEELLIHFSPSEVIQPVSGVGHDFNGSTGSSQEIPPFKRVYFIISEQNLGSEQERKE